MIGFKIKCIIIREFDTNVQKFTPFCLKLLPPIKKKPGGAPGSKINQNQIYNQ